MEKKEGLTYEEEKNLAKKALHGFTIGDMPLWVLKKFMVDVKERYNDIYWVKLMELMRKAEAYDELMSGRQEEADEFSEEVEGKDYVQTMSGKVRNDG